ncbi:calcium-translocating P-type ATPase, PMCA-type [Thiococcus pfennigii]|uniref:calcium-translocating P-type ATPase, PMCA-type n=1 Tax=Thiococcus pfennigii TaxID=1057 RepID=UPI001903BF50|nr:calcium-translocating P-type ATPase, PMCA-type [Thiococcus pfennigii]MBK1700868.1 calcium-translocating P-type ATPase, PMCA-type [Thiococcus pfennigii]MBK1730465.1 calcium-translocating P-type ATPase, PMCA-type [Thiococcus pfennigii]
MKFAYPGLTDEEAARARAEHGSNAVASQETEGFWDKLVGNLKDPIIVILIVALLITLALWLFGYAEWYESVGIAFAVVIATFVATWSEYSNEQSFQRLLEEASMILVKVFRNGHLTEIPINDLVVGDHVLLQPGDTVPTDGLLIAGHAEIDEAALTGESEPVKKTAVREGAEPTAADDANRLFRAGLLVDGECVMRVTAVGDRTRYGQTMKELVSAEDRLSPLQHKLTVLGGHIATFGYIGATFIFLAFMFNNIFLQGGGMEAYWAQDGGTIVKDFVTAAILAIIVIVVAVPEGLPMMIAMVLAINMKKLLSVKVLVRKLLGIETAGSLNILCTDKTGTLTQGRLSVSAVLDGNGTRYERLEDIPQALRDEAGFALRNNTSAVIDASDPNDIKTVGADRTEQALLRFVTPYLAQDGTVDIVDLIPFNSTRKFSATQVTGPRSLTLVKGAPEVILKNCRRYLNGDDRPHELTDTAALEQAMGELSARAMRLLAVAVTDTPIDEGKALPADLTLVGVFGMRDELRETAYASVKTAKDAGIHVVMITGDAKETAQAIAKDVGLLEDDPEAVIMTSAELGELSDDELKGLLPHLYVVARAFPTDKSRLVKLAKELGLVVGMTGDGVNDAPAVKNADVGFAMGSGTEMTKESSDIVILDDNFSSLTKAVLYGRTLFKSIRKFLIFQLTVNVSAILVVFLGQFFGFDLPLTMTQLLWLNIIMDTLAGLAFAGEAALQRYMQERPLRRDEPLINADMWSSILINGGVIAALSILFLTSPITQGWFDGGHAAGSAEAEAKFLTAFFAFFVFVQIFNTFNARTQGLNLFEHMLDNRLFTIIIPSIMVIQVFFISFGGEVLRTVGLSLQEWLLVLTLAILIVPIDLLRKVIRNLTFGNPVHQAG